MICYSCQLRLCSSLSGGVIQYKMEENKIVSVCSSCGLRLQEYGLLWPAEDVSILYLEGDKIKRLCLTAKKTEAIHRELMGVYDPYERIEIVKNLAFDRPRRRGRPRKVLCNA